MLTSLLPFLVFANSVPPHQEIPIDGYKLITRTIHEYNQQKKYSIDMSYPVISGNNLNNSAKEFNQAIQYIMQNDIAVFKSLISNAVPKYHPISTFKMDCDITIIKPKNSPLISIRFTITEQKSDSPSTRPSKYHETVNYNFEEGLGKNIPLASLFKPDSNYKAILDRFMKNKLDMLKIKGLSEIAKEQVLLDEPQFNLRQTGLLLTYDEGAIGPQEVFVPYNALAHIISNASPIEVCVTRPKECEQER